MSSPEEPLTSWSLYSALMEKLMKDDSSAAIIHVLSRLLTEVEALREALSSPDTPESVRQSYREAYARIAVLSHNAAGPSGGLQKILARYFPRDRAGHEAEYAAERMMMKRLGATEEETEKLCEKMDEVSMYT